jgi:hypothetical protein
MLQFRNSKHGHPEQYQVLQSAPTMQDPVEKYDTFVIRGERTTLAVDRTSGFPAIRRKKI